MNKDKKAKKMHKRYQNTREKHTKVNASNSGVCYEI